MMKIARLVLIIVLMPLSVLSAEAAKKVIKTTCTSLQGRCAVAVGAECFRKADGRWYWRVRERLMIQWHACLSKGLRRQGRT